MQNQLPQAVGTGLLGGIPLVPGAAAPIMANSGQRIGVAIHGSKHGDKISKDAQAAEAFLNPNAPTAASLPALSGTAASNIAKQILDKRKKAK